MDNVNELRQFILENVSLDEMTPTERGWSRTFSGMIGGLLASGIDAATGQSVGSSQVINNMLLGAFAGKVYDVIMRFVKRNERLQIFGMQYDSAIANREYTKAEVLKDKILNLYNQIPDSRKEASRKELLQVMPKKAANKLIGSEE